MQLTSEKLGVASSSKTQKKQAILCSDYFLRNKEKLFCPRFSKLNATTCSSL